MSEESDKDLRAEIARRLGLASDAELKDAQAELNARDGKPLIGDKAARARCGRAKLIIMENLKMTPIVWVWEGWLASGAIHLIAGIPEAGKTTVALAIAATTSSGGDWPDGTRAKPGHVLIWTGEDDPERTIKPRLIQMGRTPKKSRS